LKNLKKRFSSRINKAEEMANSKTGHLKFLSQRSKEKKNEGSLRGV
jgi:hypothetical protein